MKFDDRKVQERINQLREEGGVGGICADVEEDGQEEDVEVPEETEGDKAEEEGDEVTEGLELVMDLN